jgi:hypothetical protein
MDASAWAGIGLSVFAVVVAIVVPLGIERARWPDLRVDKADDANARHLTPQARFVHVRVTNLHFRTRGQNSRFPPVGPLPRD